MPWGQLLFAVVNLRVPPEAVPEDEEEREKSEWWKAKKWACAILGRLFHRWVLSISLFCYTNRYMTGTATPPSSRRRCRESTARLHNISSRPLPRKSSRISFPKSIFMSPVRYGCRKSASISCSSSLPSGPSFHFMLYRDCQTHTTFSIKPKSTWALLKPSYENLVSSYVFPQLSFNHERQSLWEADPVDYVRVSVGMCTLSLSFIIYAQYLTDEYESYATPVSAATTFLLSLASNRTKVAFMPILEVINRVLRS